MEIIKFMELKHISRIHPKNGTTVVPRVIRDVLKEKYKELDTIYIEVLWTITENKVEVDFNPILKINIGSNIQKPKRIVKIIEEE